MKLEVIISNHSGSVISSKGYLKYLRAKLLKLNYEIARNRIFHIESLKVIKGINSMR